MLKIRNYKFRVTNIPEKKLPQVINVINILEKKLVPNNYFSWKTTGLWITIMPEKTTGFD